MESYVQWVYDFLLNGDLEGERVTVARNITIKGGKGIAWRFDVYYRFTRADLDHQVLIEVKDTGRKVDADEVAAFALKVKDVGGSLGVMVSRSGFQPKARATAEQEGVIALGPGEFPDFFQIVARMIAASALPDEESVGAPFYTLMERGEGRAGVTGSYFCLRGPDDRKTIALFFSGAQAARFKADIDPKDHYVVRGLSQRQLIVLLRLATLHGENAPILDFALADPCGGSADGIAPFVRADRSALFRDFVRVPVAKTVWDPEAHHS